MLKIYDTTLRDGGQQQGVSYSIEDKVRISKKLDELGIHYIEGGWPGSNPKDIEYFKRVNSMTFQQAKIVAFGSTKRPYIEASEDHNLNEILNAGVDYATLFGKSWDLHVKSALKVSKEENLKMIYSSIKYLKDHGLTVFYDAEHFFDGYKSDRNYALETIKTAQNAGADAIVLCDTNGGTLVRDVERIVKDVREQLSVDLGIHAHNDSDVAVANSMVAVDNGVTQVQGTINGLGERCGNANLCSLIPNFKIKYAKDLLKGIDVSKISHVSRFVSELLNEPPAEGMPYVGKSAFTHKAGIHVNAILKNPDTYEHIMPDIVGNQREIVVSELSGRSNLLHKAEELGIEIDKNNQQLRRVLDKIKALEYQGFHFEGADASFKLLFEKELNNYKNLFDLENVRVITEKTEDKTLSEASIRVRVKNKEVHTAALGNGPVNALDKALRKALIEFYPSLEAFQLIDYKVRVLDSNDGTAAKVRVLIETGNKSTTWGTVGASTNIIEASWQALVDSIEYGLLFENAYKNLNDDDFLIESC